MFKVINSINLRGSASGKTSKDAALQGFRKILFDAE
jgi:hypothetical protein